MVRSLDQVYTASEWQSQDLNPDDLAPEFILVTTAPCLRVGQDCWKDTVRAVASRHQRRAVLATLRLRRQAGKTQLQRGVLPGDSI